MISSERICRCPWSLDIESDLRAQVATLTRERDEARKQSEIYRAAWGPAEGRIVELHKNLTKIRAAHDQAVKERDEAKGESEQYKKMLHGNSPSKVQYNAMVDDVGAALGYVSWSLKTWSMLMNEIRQIRADSATFVRERDEAVRERDEAVRERDEAKGLLAITTGQFDAMKKLADNAVKDRDEANRLASHYTSLVITVRDERDAARARIAELESAKWNVEAIVFHKNGTWEWRKG